MHLYAFLTILLAASACGYHILCVFPTPSRSHNLLAKGIVAPLLKAGHQVTWVTPFNDPNTNNNLRIIQVNTLRIAETIDMTERSKEGMAFVQQFATNLTMETYHTPALRDALLKTKFDAVVSEWFFSDTDAGYAAVLQVPWIVLSGVTLPPHLNILVDDIHSVPTVPMFFNNYPVPMNFWQRVVTTVLHVVVSTTTMFDRLKDASRYEEIFTPLAAARGVRLPPFAEALNNVSVLLVNSHPSLAPVLSLPPNVVDIAGYHIDEHVPPLPEELQALLDSSPSVIYFSMGSVVKPSQIPEHTRRSLLQLFGKLPHTVLWKCDPMDDVPKNVVVRQWWPQASVLAHPNVKLFITHSGFLSTLEAINFGVPLLAVPVFGDQPLNADRAVSAGYALKVDYSPDMVEELGQALMKMMESDSYYKRAKYLSRLFKKRPVAPSKLVLHYVEMAIESKGAYHLRSLSHLYPWYQRWMLDQLAALLLLLWTLAVAARALITKLMKKDKSKSKKKRN